MRINMRIVGAIAHRVICRSSTSLIALLVEERNETRRHSVKSSALMIIVSLIIAFSFWLASNLKLFANRKKWGLNDVLE